MINGEHKCSLILLFLYLYSSRVASSIADVLLTLEYLDVSDDSVSDFASTSSEE